MADSVYRVTEVIGVSNESWEAAARSAIETASKSRPRPAHRRGSAPGLTIGDGGELNYRIRLAISFKYEPADL